MLAQHPMYVVTDGHKIVQSKKAKALKLDGYFRRVFITHRYGKYHAKPSIYCFSKIRQVEKCEWKEMWYIGDNPAKDFVNLTPLGVHTVRVLTGPHADVAALPKHDAKHTFPDLGYLLPLLQGVKS